MSTEGARLLVIENDHRLGELLAGFLERRGYSVQRAVSYAEARPLLLSEPPRLLLSDLELGEEDAREILPQLAAEGVLPPTLVVSGYLDLSVTTELEAIPGVVGFVPKPFEFDQLLAAIEGALALSAAGPAPGPAPGPSSAPEVEVEAEAEPSFELAPESPPESAPESIPSREPAPAQPEPQSEPPQAPGPQPLGRTYVRPQAPGQST